MSDKLEKPLRVGSRVATSDGKEAETTSGREE